MRKSVEFSDLAEKFLAMLREKGGAGEHTLRMVKA